ncbi:MAG TPA: beta-CASP ribonuclease aCPSF1 [Candidatus Aenigmarchaeota archaeon]|nr:beta-CASP ribonuclease aCPSF1 [Candidatus Aenigmarchaeota archaeon]
MSILKELQEKLPKDAQITEIKFEGSEIVIYTKNKDFFRNSEAAVMGIVSQLKKRIEVRPDISITMDMEKARKRIEEITPKDAGIHAIYFEPELGKVIIEAQKPGLVIGKGGETFRKIKEETLWLPKIERAPAIKSEIVNAVRALIHTEIDYRKKFLNRIGQKINEKPSEPIDRSREWIRISCLGGFRQVGRSCILVQTKRSNILLDCGVDPGSNEPPFLDVPEFDLEKLDAICLTHAHIDHCAYIPYLYDQGFTGPLYCTPPTRDLMVLLCLDYIDVCRKNGKDTYPKKAVEKAVKHTITLGYGEVSDITCDTRLTFHPSGHLLGSSMIHLHIGEGLHNILYTGDFKFGPSRLFNPATTQFQRVETLIIESTYGAPEDVLPPRREVEEKLLSIINNTMKEGGKVLIPSFAVGRAQEIMTILAQSGFDYPVYMEGMVWAATAIHTAYPEYLSRYLQREIFHRGRNPFISDIFKKVSPRERQSIIDSGEPAVIIATSGMLIGGPAIEYLKGLAHNKKNKLVFVGYQGEGTLGRRIQKGWREIPLPGEDGRTKILELKLGVESVYGLTGHSGRRQIMSYIRNLTCRPERIIVNHGEQKKCLELSRDIHRVYRIETIAPRNMECVRLK